MNKDLTGNSDAQKMTEETFRSILKDKFGSLPSANIVLSDGSKIQIDGWNDSKNIFAEFYSRQGPLKDGQKKKIARDILKLAWLGRDREGCRVIFCHANKSIQDYLTNGSWLAQAMASFKVEIEDLSDRLPEAIRNQLLEAQRIQAAYRKAPD
jgi:hypothetical protein